MSAPASHLKVVQVSDPPDKYPWTHVVFDDGSFWIHKGDDFWQCRWQPDGTSDAFKIRCLEAANEELRSKLADAKDDLRVAADLMSQLLKDAWGEHPAYLKKYVASFIRTFKEGAK